MLLVLDVADVEHESYQALLAAHAQGLALQAIPGRRGVAVGAVQAYAQQQWRAFVLQILQAAAQLFAVGGVHLREPVLQRQTLLLKIQGAGQRGSQLHLGAVAEDFPPAGAEQGLQRLQALQLQMVAMFAQAFQQGAGEGGGELQPVTLADIRGLLLDRVTAAEQPGHHALGIVIGHGETLRAGKDALQARMFAQVQVMRRGAVQAIETGAQALTGAPQAGRIEAGVVLVNLPALLLLIEQRQGDTGNVKALGQCL
ncbi:hypothetical protein D3C76_843420 [compost metagenome]